MSTIVIFCFLIIFALLLFSISFGLKFYESRRRNQLVSMLRTVTENGVEQHVNLLIDPEEKKKGADALAGSVNIAEKLTNLLAESGLDWKLEKLLFFSGGAALLGLIVGLAVPVASPPLPRAAIGAGLGMAMPFLYVRKQRSKRLAEFESHLPDALDFLARSMRAGHAFTMSLEMVGQEIADPLGQEFRALFNEQNLGASLDRAFSNFAKRVPLPDVRFFSSAVLLQRQTGGNLSEILNRLSHIIRERFRLKGQVKATSAHGRLTATILTLLPIGTLAGLIVTSPGYLDSMVNDSIGRKLLGAGVAAQIIGNLVIRKVIKIKV
ncbi:MAG TPA: type II secretion system F family protein [Bryobacteraceae bacterium]|nr:type II secretion system F family protein [Bryobacteraceae bacterium]